MRTQDQDRLQMSCASSFSILLFQASFPLLFSMAWDEQSVCAGKQCWWSGIADSLDLHAVDPPRYLALPKKCCGAGGGCFHLPSVSSLPPLINRWGKILDKAEPNASKVTQSRLASRTLWKLPFALNSSIKKQVKDFVKSPCHYVVSKWAVKFPFQWKSFQILQ